MTESRTEPRSYPVHVDARLDEPLSRWLWLVKGLLTVPHYLVLVLLWPALVVVSVLAFFAILVTGRYPRPLFDFAVGVLRWTWRVQYYSFSALGTDRYPPFTLADVPDYPARLSVEYPERLSRGLVLVKWWLLAIPHYLVLAVFVGGGAWYVGRSSHQGGVWAGGSLLGLLVLVSAVVLLVTGRYPRPVYDFVMGMDRWVLRVVGYVALLTDRYPPFRLDMGGPDPAAGPAVPPAPAPVAGGAPAPVAGGAPASRWTAGRVVALVAGALLLLTSAGFLTGGGALLWVDRTHRDGSFLVSDAVRLDTSGSALQTGSLQLDTQGAGWVNDEVLGTALLRVTPQDQGVPLFVGLGRTADVEAWLSGVARGRVTDVGVPGPQADVVEVAGGAAAGPPAAAGVWTATATGPGTQELRWRPADGDWTAVVMRADGAPGVHVSAVAGLTAPALGWVALGLLATGVVLLVAGALLVVFATRRTVAGPPSALPSGPAPVPVPAHGAPR